MSTCVNHLIRAPNAVRGVDSCKPQSSTNAIWSCCTACRSLPGSVGRTRRGSSAPRPAALSARWQRLRSAGLAWVTAHPGGTFGHVVVALVEVDCVPGARAEVVRVLCRDARVVTVEESTRGRDLLLTVMTRDLRALTAFALDDLPCIPGVDRQRTYLTTAVHRDGSKWRLDALDPERQAAFAAASQVTNSAQGVTPPPNAWPLIEALAADGRRSAADLARITRRTPATVQRQLNRLLSCGLLSVRCEVAQAVSRRSISCTWAGRVAAADHDRTVAALATLPELRLCASTTGGTNMMITVWVRSLMEVHRLELLLGERLPWLQLRETAVNLRTPKRMGWMLGPDGRTTGEVVAPIALAGV
jgi:DNA-binding Lrp family transcriptional regulator